MPLQSPKIIKSTESAEMVSESRVLFEMENGRWRVSEVNDTNLVERQPGYEIYLTDAFEWLARRTSNSIHAVVTDPPYGLVEYSRKELDKRANGKGGIWRIPPTFDGC